MDEQRKGENAAYWSRPRESSGKRRSAGVVKRGRILDLRLLARMLRLAQVMFFSSMSVVLSVIWVSEMFVCWYLLPQTSSSALENNLREDRYSSLPCR